MDAVRWNNRIKMDPEVENLYMYLLKFGWRVKCSFRLGNDVIIRLTNGCFSRTFTLKPRD